jgi:hypothetical protein
MAAAKRFFAPPKVYSMKSVVAVFRPVPSTYLLRATFSAFAGLIIMTFAILSARAEGAIVNTPSTNANANLPTSVKATYKVHRNGLLVGNVEEKFERLGSNRYTITSTTRTEGIAALITRDQLNVTSEGKIAASGLVPSIFSSLRKTDTKRNFVTRFDWAKNEIVREYQHDGNNEKESFELPKGTQDRLSSMYQFMVTTPQSKTISTSMTQGKEVEQYTYLKQGEPTMATKAGEFETVHYARDAKVGESKAEIWLAKAKNYVPIKIIFEDNKGNKIEQSLVDLVIVAAE